MPRRRARRPRDSPGASGRREGDPGDLRADRPRYRDLVRGPAAVGRRDGRAHRDDAGPLPLAGARAQRRGRRVRLRERAPHAGGVPVVGRHDGLRARVGAARRGRPRAVRGPARAPAPPGVHARLRGYHAAERGQRRCPQAVGFRPLVVYQGVGFKLGQWHDVGWWEHHLQPLPTDPSPPVPLPTIVGSPDVARISRQSATD
jgi:hypothetical protein